MDIPIFLTAFFGGFGIFTTIGSLGFVDHESSPPLAIVWGLVSVFSYALCFGIGATLP